MPPWTKQAVAALCVAGSLGIAACGSSARHTTTVAQVSTPVATTNAAQTVPATGTKAPSRPAVGHPKTAKKTTPADPVKATSTTVTTSTTTDPVSSSTTATAKKPAVRRGHVDPVHYSPPPRPNPARSRSVLVCLTRAGITHASVASSTLWSGFRADVGTFVYVYLYPTVAAAVTAAHVVADEEVGRAGRYVIQQPIAPYRGSPVPTVTVCLGGKAPKPPAQKTGTFKF